MELTDVRRLTGPNYLLDRAGAAAEILIEPGDTTDMASVLGTLVKHLGTLLKGVGWDAETMTTRTYPGGGSVYMTAPIDALYSATSLIEAAWDMLEAVEDRPSQSRLDALKEEIADEQHPELLTLRDAAKKHGKAFLSDDDDVSIGLGAGRILWDVKNIPSPENVDWDTVSNIPTALVTGTNGKSTTVRLACAIAQNAGYAVASSSSDYVKVGDTILDKGDYSGPGGARMGLRDQRAEMAILETARGGLMRRGLPITNIEACLITNVSADHLGEYGVTDVPSLADAKFMVAKAVSPNGRMILNYDDPELVKRAKSFEGHITWYGLSVTDTFLQSCQSRGEHVAYLRDDMLWLQKDGKPQPVIAVHEFPLSMGGVARFNIANGLGAIALTSALGIDIKAMKSGLSGFESTPENNPGRGNFFTIGGVKILLDFAHNPEGVRALSDAVKAVPAKRKLFLLGQGGDRSDNDIADITKAVHASDPDMIIIKELPKILRGRQPGEVPALIRKTLQALKVPDDAIMEASCELEAVKMALKWANPEDLLVLLVYGERQEVLDYLALLRDNNWQSCQALPV